MNESADHTRTPQDETARDRAFRQAQVEDIGDRKLLAFRLKLQSMPTLLTVLTTVARLGCRVAYVFAFELQVEIGVFAPLHVAHRVQGCLDQIIEVLAISEVTPRTENPSAFRSCV